MSINPQVRDDLASVAVQTDVFLATGIFARPLLKMMVDKKASDLFFSPNSVVKIKIEGDIVPANQDVLTAKAIEKVAFAMMTPEQLKTYREQGEVEYGLSEMGLGRFRVNVFSQRGHPAMVLRYLTPELRTLDQLGMPSILKSLTLERQGLVLVVGANGVGKSTTLAAMVDYRNEHCADHILAIEDPIEFLHSNKKSIVNQREIGTDVQSYQHALKNGMRAAPNMVVIGEVRDRETMEAALLFAATGHLCVATIHANNAAEAVERACNLFPREQSNQVFLDLSQYLRAVVAQRLVRGVGRQRLAAVEVLINSPHVQELIKKGDISGLKEAMNRSTERGMQSFDQALEVLVKTGKVQMAEALAHADSRAHLETKLNFG